MSFEIEVNAFRVTCSGKTEPYRYPTHAQALYDAEMCYHFHGYKIVEVSEAPNMDELPLCGVCKKPYKDGSRIKGVCDHCYDHQARDEDML